MKVLLYSSVFPPSIGGVETIAVTLATKLVEKGHDCVVVTETRSDGDDAMYPFKVYRAPSRRKRFQLAKESSVVHSNGASVAMYFYALLAGVPFMWTHNGYQVLCIDGLGWAYGQPAPMSPWQSMLHHGHKRGTLYACHEGMKLWMRRVISNHVDLNVACTEWVAGRLNLSRQVVAYTPYGLNSFRSQQPIENAIFDFIYVGRLVSEKGIDDLISAMALHCRNARFSNSKLVIVGDGPMREVLERQVDECGIQKNVSFQGAKRGDELQSAILRGRCGVVPSRWEEPMGGVALELLSSGRKLIVSERGGHAECVRGAALTFPNGDVNALSKCLDQMQTQPVDEQKLDKRVREIIECFDENLLTDRYINLYESLIDRA